MNKITKSLLLVCALFLCGQAYAEPLSARTDLQSMAARGEQFDVAMPVVRVSGFDREAEFVAHQKADLTNKNFNMSNVTTFNDVRITSIGNEKEFSLAVYANGEKVSFDDNRLMARAIMERKSLGEPISVEQAVNKADAYLNNTIKPMLRLGQNELIEPYQVLKAIYGEGDQERFEESITAYFVIYTRKINGIHVIGAGSKIRVMVGVDGTILGYRYDWPKVDEVMPAVTVSQNEFERRKEKICNNGNLNCKDLKVVDRFECGIYDPGSLHRYGHDVNVLQPACMVSLKADKSSAEAFMMFIPLSRSEDIVVDSKWFETEMLVNDKKIHELLPKYEGKILE